MDTISFETKKQEVGLTALTGNKPIDLIELFRLLKNTKAPNAYVYTKDLHNLAYNVTDITPGRIIDNRFVANKDSRLLGLGLLYTNKNALSCFGYQPLQVKELNTILSVHIESLNGKTIVHLCNTLLSNVTLIAQNSVIIS